MIRLENMEPNQYQVFMDLSLAYFAEEQIQAGSWSEENAEQKALEQFEQLLPQGQETEGHEFLMIVDEGKDQQVGSIWLGKMEIGGGPACFLYQIIIDTQFRRQGYASQALQALETVAADWGRDSIWLNVFAENEGAIILYKNLGYKTIKSYPNEKTGEDISYLLSKKVVG